MNERIKVIREYLGLSQAKFAQKIHRSPGHISNIETNVCAVSDDTVQRVCNAFSVNEVWLRTGKGVMIDSAPADKEGIGSRLKRIRKDARLTQIQFAEKVGYTQAHVHATEAGKAIPSDAYLQRVMILFNVKEQWLLSGTGDMRSDPVRVDEELIEWLNNNPSIVLDLMRQSGRV